MQSFGAAVRLPGHVLLSAGVIAENVGHAEYPKQLEPCIDAFRHGTPLLVATITSIAIMPEKAEKMPRVFEPGLSPVLKTVHQGMGNQS